MPLNDKNKLHLRQKDLHAFFSDIGKLTYHNKHTAISTSLTVAQKSRTDEQHLLYAAELEPQVIYIAIQSSTHVNKG